jgi:hypothetical protein
LGYRDSQIGVPGRNQPSTHKQEGIQTVLQRYGWSYDQTATKVRDRNARVHDSSVNFVDCYEMAVRYWDEIERGDGNILRFVEGSGISSVRDGHALLYWCSVLAERQCMQPHQCSSCALAL